MGPETACLLLRWAGEARGPGDGREAPEPCEVPPAAPRSRRHPVRPALMEPFTSFFQARRSGPLRGRQAGQRAAGGGGGRWGGGGGRWTPLRAGSHSSVRVCFVAVPWGPAPDARAPLAPGSCSSKLPGPAAPRPGHPPRLCPQSARSPSPSWRGARAASVAQAGGWLWCGRPAARWRWRTGQEASLGWGWRGGWAGWKLAGLAV